MTAPRDLTRERRLRRMADRRGYVLERSRRLDRLAIDYGLWRLAPAGDVPAEQSGPSFRLTLDEVEDALTPSEDDETHHAAA